MKKLFAVLAYLGIVIMLLGVALIIFVTVDDLIQASSDAGFEWVTPLLYLVGGVLALAGSVLASLGGIIAKPGHIHSPLIVIGIIYLVCYFAIIIYLLNRTAQSGSMASDIDNLVVWSFLFLLPAIVSISGGVTLRKSGGSSSRRSKKKR